jgi:membrane protein DedA with SNARE-associated domain
MSGHLIGSSGGVTGVVARAILGVIRFAGYGGVFALLAVESIGAPIPSELVLPFAGVLASEGRMNLWIIGTLGALACDVGSGIAYEIARRGGRPLIERWGRYLLLTPHDLDRSERFFQRTGGRAVFIGRLLPVVRGLVSYPAGVARMNRLRFHLYTFAGSWPWCTGLAALGMELGRAWARRSDLHRYFHWGAWIVIAVCVAFVARFVWVRLRRRRR